MTKGIKYRAWDKINKKMLNWYEFLDTNVKDTFITPESTGLILTEYIGICDKNGKEIYRNDIIKFKNKNDKFNECPKIALIIWSEENLAYNLISPNRILEHENLSYYLNGYDLEIIGNIYEIPDFWNLASKYERR